MRVYVPSTLEALSAAIHDDRVGAPHGTAFAVTPELRATDPAADEEELEYLAMLDAARASLRLLAAVSTDRPALRVVVAADVDQATIREDLDRAVVRLSGTVPWSQVAAVHIDGADAADAVAAAVEAIDAAELGDLDAEFIVGSAQDFELAWYSPGEVVYLLEELGLDS